MPNRSTDLLPAVFYEAPPFFPEQGRYLIPCPLAVREFTFLHFHRYIELGFCIKGEGICRVDGKEYPFRAGDYQIIFPYQRHLSKSTGEHIGQWYWLSLDAYASLEGCGYADLSKVEHLIGCEMGMCGIFSPDIHPEITAICRAIFEEAIQTDHPYRSEIFALESYRLLLLLARKSQGLPKLSIHRDERVLLLSEALQEIYEGVEKGAAPSVEELAKVSSMSGSTFRRVFHQVVGLPPKEYVTHCFLRKAKNLLLTSAKSILEISAECGFDNISGFNRRFLAKVGMTPSEYRKQREM